MPWKETRPMEERFRFIALEENWGGSFSELCEEFGISRRTGYKWLKRYGEQGTLAALADRSRRPRKSPRRTAAEPEEQVVAYRNEYGWGAKKIAALLQSQQGLSLSVATVNRILSRRGLVNSIHQHQPALGSFERSRPLELIQSDFKGPMGRPGNQSQPLSVLDDHSRTLLGLFALQQHTYEQVMPCFRSVFQEHGVPEGMLFDHGTPWWTTSNPCGLTKLVVFLMDQNIELTYGRIRHPQTQGKVERFHRTLDHAVAHRFHGKGPQTVAGWQPFYDEFRYTYNYIRPHESLGMQTPSTRYQKSSRVFEAKPSPWDYPQGVELHKVDAGGWIRVKGKRLFVSEALTNHVVGVEEIAQHLLVSYRRMYIRELNPKTGRSGPMVCPISRVD